MLEEVLNSPKVEKFLSRKSPVDRTLNSTPILSFSKRFDCLFFKLFFFLYSTFLSFGLHCLSNFRSFCLPNFPTSSFGRAPAGRAIRSKSSLRTSLRAFRCYPSREQSFHTFLSSNTNCVMQLFNAGNLLFASSNPPNKTKP